MIMLTQSIKCRDYLASPVLKKREFASFNWNEARRILGMSPQAESIIWGNNYYYKTGTEVTQCKNIAYKDVWKGANNFFEFNLRQQCTSPVYKTSNQYLTHTENVFSFVRDPMARFISAYRTVASRTFRSCCDENLRLKSGCVLRGVSCNILSGNELGLTEIILTKWINSEQMSYYFKHFDLMTTFLYSTLPYPKMVGRLECVNHDYDRICSALSCPQELITYDKLNEDLGHHESSLDINHFGTHLLWFLENNTKWKKAIQKLLYLDYECFQFDSDCEFDPPPSPSPPPPFFTPVPFTPPPPHSPPVSFTPPPPPLPSVPFPPNSPPLPSAPFPPNSPPLSPSPYSPSPPLSPPIPSFPLSIKMSISYETIHILLFIVSCFLPIFLFLKILKITTRYEKI